VPTVSGRWVCARRRWRWTLAAATVLADVAADHITEARLTFTRVKAGRVDVRVFA
jgi:hypothetical protein